MPYLMIDKRKKYLETNNIVPIALIRGEDGKKNKYHDYCLYYDRDKKQNPYKKKNIELDEEYRFEPLPMPHEDKRDVLLAMGKSGSGKSYFIKNFVKNYIKMHRNRKVYIVSQLQNDKTLDQVMYNEKYDASMTYSDTELDKLRIYLTDENNKYILDEDKQKIPTVKRIPVNEVYWVDMIPNANNEIFKNTFWIFDDVDEIPNKKVKLSIDNFIKQIAIIGRKHGGKQGNISLAFLTHNFDLAKSNRLKVLFTESNKYILYPKKTPPRTMKRICENYIGISANAKSRKKLKDNGRWTMVANDPDKDGMYLISRSNAEILDDSLLDL